MAWKIVLSALPGILLIEDDEMIKGEIVNRNNMYEVNMLSVKELHCKFHNYDQAIGYVRGVEATVNLYAKETGRAKK